MKLDQSDHETVRIVRVEAPALDVANLKSIRERLAPELERGRVMIDLSGVHRVDMAGMCMLNSCQRTLKERGGDLKLCGLSQDVRRQIELVPFNRLVSTFATC